MHYNHRLFLKLYLTDTAKERQEFGERRNDMQEGAVGQNSTLDLFGKDSANSFSCHSQGSQQLTQFMVQYYDTI